MDPQTRIERLDALVEAEVGGEIVGLDIERGTCFGFNATATRIWQLIEVPCTFGELCDRLLDDHEVDRATCAADTAAVLGQLADDRLIVLTAP